MTSYRVKHPKGWDFKKEEVRTVETFDRLHKRNLPTRAIKQIEKINNNYSSNQGPFS